MPAPPKRPPLWPRLILASLIAMSAAAAGAIAWESFEDFIITDSRFVVSTADDARFEITGVDNASMHSIRKVFAADNGRSLYTFPAAERRRNLLAVDWVKDATVSRIWPNRVRVHLKERRPVAFCSVGSNEESGRTVVLVDEEGVLLRPARPGDYRFHVVTGMEGVRDEARRSRGVRTMLEVLHSAGDHAAQISEVDVGERGNVKVTYHEDGRAFILSLGDTRYSERLNLFIEHYPQIRDRLPHATQFDLRMETKFITPDKAPPRTAPPGVRPRGAGHEENSGKEDVDAG